MYRTYQATISKPAIGVRLRRETKERRDDKKGNTKIYKCKTCRRAWQRPLSSKGNDTEYFPTYIMGDLDKICPECSAKSKDKE